MYKKLRILQQNKHERTYIKKNGGKYTIEVDMNLSGDMLSQEEAIQIALNEAAKLTTNTAHKSHQNSTALPTTQPQKIRNTKSAQQKQPAILAEGDAAFNPVKKNHFFRPKLARFGKSVYLASEMYPDGLFKPCRSTIF